MNSKLAEAINKYRNEPIFHKLVQLLQYWIRDDLITITELKNALLIIEYDEELNKRGIGKY